MCVVVVFLFAVVHFSFFFKNSIFRTIEKYTYTLNPQEEIIKSVQLVSISHVKTTSNYRTANYIRQSFYKY